MNSNELPINRPWEDPSNIPAEDNAEAAKHISESTVTKLILTLHEIIDMVDAFDDMAPRSSRSVWELLSIVGGEVAAWIRRWP